LKVHAENKTCSVKVVKNTKIKAVKTIQQSFAGLRKAFLVRTNWLTLDQRVTGH
jgi:hypothetical protein